MAKSDNGELNNSNLASNNSDPNNSLLQKVTKRVSGLFPSSITKWFGPSDGSTSVIRRRETEDDDEQLQIQQPPKKRAKSATTTANATATATEVEFSTSNHFQMTSTPLINSRIQTGGQPSNYTRHTITSVMFDGPSTSAAGARGEPIFNGDDDKSDSGESTSGYSSVLVQQNKEPSFVSGERAINQPTTSKQSSTPSPNKSQNTSRSLFSEQSLNPQRQCLSARRPSFNSSTFGSPTFVDRTLSTKRAVNSPFYGGRTIYGGASAYKRNRIIFPRDESNTVHVKNSVNIKPVNDASSSQDNVCMSKTARRILDTLEHISTPVVDAKKIPNINRQKSRLTPYARDGAPTKPSNRELIIPSVPDLLKMKQKERLQNSTELVRKLATTSKSVLNEYSIRTLDDETAKPQKQTHKMKVKKALYESVDAVQLPDVKLPITNLPKFDFTLPPPPTPTPTQKPTLENKKSTQSAKKVPVNTDGYKFAKPIVVISDMPSIKSINHFKFSEPIDAKNPTPSFTFKAESGSTAPRKKDQKYNGQNDVGFSLQPPEKLTDGSVMDVLGKSDPVMDKFKPALGTWECLSCMVRNIATATRCVACESLKEPIKKSDPKPSNVNNFGSQFKMSAEKWECGVCMVRNNQSDTKCVACTTPNPKTTQTTKPPTTTTTTTTPASIFGGFGDKFKPATDTWECEACMIRNKSEVNKCVACETPKPGTTATTKPTLVMRVADAPASSGGFSDFIKKQQTNWECPSCMVRNPPEKKACVCCEGPKPGEKQEFSFGSSGTQFKFGIDKNSTPTPTGFTFGVKPTPSTTGSLYGAHPIGNTTYSVPPTTTGFTFGVQPTESQKNTPPATTTTTPAENKIDVTKTTTTTPTPPPPTFSFGLPKTTPTVVLNGDPKKMFSFGTQSTTITSSSSSTTKPTNIFSPVVTATESNSTVSSTVATTTPSTTFSFGATPKQTNDDKKPPQFNFGSGSLPFNPVFGSNITKTTSSFVQPTTNFLNTTSQSTTFSFKPTTTTTPSVITATTPINNNNKTEVKPFSFTKTEPPKFSFNPLSTANTTTTTPTPTPTPLSKAPVINFADAAQKTPNSMFSFGSKTDTKPPSFGGGSVFGQNVQPTTPQNGGFNFGATAVTPNFNFGAAAATTGGGTGATANSTTPNVFGFGSSQAGSGSATAAASTPGVFTFGGGAPAQQPTAAAAFTPDIKPNFNFSGGTSIASFTAQGGPSATMPQRKIRKAVRRTQPR